jgi:hypothetical protein
MVSRPFYVHWRSLRRVTRRVLPKLARASRNGLPTASPWQSEVASHFRFLLAYPGRPVTCKGCGKLPAAYLAWDQPCCASCRRKSEDPLLLEAILRGTKSSLLKRLTHGQYRMIRMPDPLGAPVADLEIAQVQDSKLRAFLPPALLDLPLQKLTEADPARPGRRQNAAY